MNARLLHLLLLAFVAVSPASAGVDFTPVEGERKLCGRVFKQLIFREDGHKITYEQPPGWTYRGEGSRITFMPPKVSFASSSIEQTALQAPVTFDEATLQALQQEFLLSLPKGPQPPVIVSAEVNPFKVNGHDTFEVVATFHDHGAEFQAAIVFVNAPKLLLRFRTTARKTDFEKLHAAFRGSIFSWEWQQGGRIAGAPGGPSQVAAK
jgi:hypothetical protein